MHIFIFLWKKFRGVNQTRPRTNGTARPDGDRSITRRPCIFFPVLFTAQDVHWNRYQSCRWIRTRFCPAFRSEAWRHQEFKTGRWAWYEQGCWGSASGCHQFLRRVPDLNPPLPNQTHILARRTGHRACAMPRGVMNSEFQVSCNTPWDQMVAEQRAW